MTSSICRCMNGNRRVKGLQLLMIVSLTACVHARPPLRVPEECNRSHFDVAARYDTTKWSALEGAFRLVKIDTVNRRVTEVDLLRLGPLDSATKAAYTPPYRVYRRGGRIELDSVPRTAPKLAGMIRETPSLPRMYGWVVFARGVIASPCPPSAICLDNDGLSYHVTHVSLTGFLGEWYDPMLGYTVYIDPKTNRALNPPAGYFCAIRREDVSN